MGESMSSAWLCEEALRAFDRLCALERGAAGDGVEGGDVDGDADEGLTPRQQHRRLLLEQRARAKEWLVPPQLAATVIELVATADPSTTRRSPASDRPPAGRRAVGHGAARPPPPPVGRGRLPGGLSSLVGRATPTLGVDRRRRIGVAATLSPVWPTVARTLAVIIEREEPRRAHHPPATTRRPSPAPPVSRDSPWLRAILVGAPALAIAGGIVGILLKPGSGAGFVVVGVIVPAVIVALLALGARHRLAVYGAVVVLDLEAILAGAILAAGLALAIVVPLVGVARPGRPRSAGARGDIDRRRRRGHAERRARDPRGPGPRASSAGDGRHDRHLRDGRDLRPRSTGGRPGGCATLSTWRSRAGGPTRAEAELADTSDLLGAPVEASPSRPGVRSERRVTVWNSASSGSSAGPRTGHRASDADRDGARRRAGVVPGPHRAHDRRRAGPGRPRPAPDQDGRRSDRDHGLLRDHAGRPIGVAGQLADVTERVTIGPAGARAAPEAIGAWRRSRTTSTTP
jgi:hypothetical protein